MATYNYLVASLPMLFFGDPPPVSTVEFRRMCDGVLSTGDGRTLELVLDGRSQETTAGCARAWAAIETQIRNAIAQVRAGAYGVDPRAFYQPHTGFRVAVQQAVADAFAKATPLDREMEIDRARWTMLDELARTEPFGLASVIAFGVKLQIAERWAALDDATGRQRLETFIQEQTSPRLPQARIGHSP